MGLKLFGLIQINKHVLKSYIVLEAVLLCVGAQTPKAQVT